MRRVDYSEYLEFVKKCKEVVVGDSRIKLEPIRVRRLIPLGDELTDVTTTVWSFPKRGSWATHRGDYRGNWSPQIPRALILMYTKPGDVVLDQMMGSGTTCIEARLLGRNCIGVDINYNAVMVTLHRLYYLEKYAREYAERGTSLTNRLGVGEEAILNILKTWSKIYHGDARNLDKIGDSTVDLVATHPPYFNIIKYSRERVDGDLSKTRDLEEYLEWMEQVARESYRVLKPGKYCAILIGDTRIHKHYVPISHYVLNVFLNVGFILKEEIIKIQHKMKTTRKCWAKLRDRGFLLIYHEKLFILRKPKSRNEYHRYKYSSKQKWIEIKI